MAELLQRQGLHIPCAGFYRRSVDGQTMTQYVIRWISGNFSGYLPGVYSYAKANSEVRRRELNGSVVQHVIEPAGQLQCESVEYDSYYDLGMC